MYHYIKECHAESADLLPWPLLKAHFGDKELLLISKGDQFVAGIVSQKLGNTYYLLVPGILMDNKQIFLKEGVGAAIYWFSFFEAQRRGCREVELGSSRPFLMSGVLQFKKKWCNRVTISNYRRNLEMHLLLCGNNIVLHKIFETNPFFFKLNGRLTGLIFLGDHTLLKGNELSDYLRQIAFDGEYVSTCVILLNQYWAVRKEEIRSILIKYTKNISILDLSGDSITELPSLLYQA